MNALNISPEWGKNIINNKKPDGQYIFKEHGIITAVDVTDGEVTVEKFNLKSQADKWLIGIPAKNADGKWLNMPNTR